MLNSTFPQFPSQAQPSPNPTIPTRPPELEPDKSSTQHAASTLRHLAPMGLFGLLVLAVVFVAPFVARNIQYHLTLGRLEAERDMARTQLLDPELQSRLATSSEAFRLVAQAAGPAVGHISIEKIIPASDMSSLSNLEGHPGVHTQGDGSGVVVDSEGYIVTNHHVVQNAQDIRVKLPDGRRVAAQLIGEDPMTDLALLKVNETGLVAAMWGDSSNLEVGDWVVAMGSPFGLDRSVTAGILSAKGRRRVVEDIAYQDFLQTDAAVNPGNSGGPLLNLRGEVVGINTAILGKTFQGVSFAIPSSIAQTVYLRLRHEGRVQRGWLGVALEEVNSHLAEKYKLNPPHGAHITHVRPGDPAHRAGLQAGDIVLSWQGSPIIDPADFSFQVAQTNVAEEAKITVLRDGQQKTLQVTVGLRPTLPSH